jgi:putative tricarboxylic transport membrane protein
MKHPDTLAGIVLLSFCGIAYWLTTGFPEVPAMLSQNVPPTFFPRIVIGVTAVLSLSLVFGGLRQVAGVAKKIEIAVPITASIIILAGVLVTLLGTFVTLTLVTVALPLAWGERRLWAIGSLALGLPISIYVVFTIALGIRFPPAQILSWFS